MMIWKQNIYLAEQDKVQQTSWNPILNSICRSHLRSGKTFDFVITEKILKWGDLLTKFQCDFVTGSYWVERNRLLLTVTCLLFLFMAVPFSFRRSVCFCQMESKSPLWIQLFFFPCFLESTSQYHVKKNKQRGLLRIYLKQCIVVASIQPWGQHWCLWQNGGCCTWAGLDHCRTVADNTSSSPQRGQSHAQCKKKSSSPAIPQWPCRKNSGPQPLRADIRSWNVADTLSDLRGGSEFSVPASRPWVVEDHSDPGESLCLARGWHGSTLATSSSTHHWHQESETVWSDGAD